MEQYRISNDTISFNGKSILLKDLVFTEYLDWEYDLHLRVAFISYKSYNNTIELFKKRQDELTIEDCKPFFNLERNRTESYYQLIVFIEPGRWEYWEFANKEERDIEKKKIDELLDKYKVMKNHKGM